MKIEKRGKSYRVRFMISGENYSLSFDHKPTQVEISELIEKKKNAKNGKLTFQEACDSYIEARTKTLSPSTIRGYKNILTKISDDIMDKYIDDITQHDIQIQVNTWASDKSPKTVRNYHGFISSVLAEFRHDMILSTSLPQKIKHEPYIPNSEEIKQLLNYAKGSEFELVIYLGIFSMRRSEVCALTEDDIDYDKKLIRVNKAMVLNDQREWVIKPVPKTAASDREIPVPDQVIDLIKERGLFKQNPTAITNWMLRTERSLGMNEFSFHKLRHYFASEAHAKGIVDADIMKIGGWETDHVMKAVYRHSQSKDDSHITTAILNDLL